jgi:hypothetical protein
MSALPDRIVMLNEANTFLRIARAYHAQADLLLRARPKDAATTQPGEFGLPVRHLYSHSIELYLKSFLRACGIDRQVLKNQFKHKLGELYAEAKNKQLVIDTADVAHFETVVDRLKNGHEDYEFRYFEGSIGTVDPEWIERATQALSVPVAAAIGKLLSDLVAEGQQLGLKPLWLPSQAVMSIGGPTK